MIGPIFTLIYDEARKIWYYRRLLGGTAALIFVAASAYIFAIPKTYETWGQLFVQKQTPLSAATDGVSMGSNSYSSAYLVQHTLLSDENLAKIVLQLNPQAVNFDRPQLDGAAASLRSRIKVKAEDDGDGFVEFRVTDGDPVRAQKITQAVMNQFIAENISSSRKNLAQVSGFLDEQIATYEKLLEQSQAEMSAFRRQHPGVAVVATPAAPGDGGAELAGARAAYASALASAGPARASASAPQDGAIAELEGRLSTLLTQYTEQYPDVVAARRQIAALKAQRAQYLATAPAQAAPANPALAAARQQLAVAQTRARSGGAAAPATPTAEWTALQRKQERLVNTYQELVSRRDSARMAQAVTGSAAANQYQVTRAPTVPLSPTGPDRKLYLALAAAFALAAGAGLAYVRASITGIFVSARAVEDAFQLPVIGTVSWESAWHLQKPARKKRALGYAKQRSLPAS